MAFVTYTPTTNVWWDIVGTPLYIISGNGDPYTYDNQDFSNATSNPSGYTQQGFKGKVLDNLAYLKVRVTPSSTNTRISNGSPSWNGSTSWAGNAPGIWSNSSNSASGQIWFPLDQASLPNGVKLASVSMDVTGSATDSSLPASMPQMKLWEVDATGTKTQIGATTTDTSANATAYKVQHQLAVSQTQTVDRSTYSYWVELIPENGANSNPGMLASSPVVMWTGTGSATLY